MPDYPSLFNQARDAANSIPTNFPAGVDDLVEYIAIDTAYGPRIYVTPASLQQHKAGGSPFSVDALLQILRPKYTVKIRGMNTPAVFHPFGEPGETKWPLVKWGGIVIGGVLALALLRGLLR